MTTTTIRLPLFLVAVLAAVRAWDLGVVTETQIQFFVTQPQGEPNIESTAANELRNMMSVTYDPVKKDIYISDSNRADGSIFRIRIMADGKYGHVQPVVAVQSSFVTGIAYDHHTSTLYWTTGIGHTINNVTIPEDESKLPVQGRVMLRFKNGEVPNGIAIDNCRGYLYWTNVNHTNPSIQKVYLNNLTSDVLVDENLFLPQGIAIDVEHNMLYWSDETETDYSIGSKNLTDGTKRLLIRGKYHQPFSVAVDRQKIYWSDFSNGAVWSLPKNANMNPNADLFYQYKRIDKPLGLITPIGSTTLVNNSYCVINKKDEGHERTAESTTTYMLQNVCKNGGRLHATNGTCTCAPGYSGEVCSDSVCDQYCENGSCSVTEDGRAICRCSEPDQVGDRCEQRQPSRCASACLNGGFCEDHGPDGVARCRCDTGYAGNACQFEKLWFAEMCEVYCKHGSSSGSVFDDCGCNGYNNNNNNNRHFDFSENMASSCKLNRILTIVIFILVAFVIILAVLTMILFRKVRLLGRRPRIKKRIVVNKSITPLTCRPSEQNQQCEITIENCCNMNICETPCFEPDFRPPKLGILSCKPQKEDKANLLSNTDMSSEDEKPPY